MSLHLNRAVLTLMVQLPEPVFARHLSASPEVVGEALAEQVMAYTKWASHLAYRWLKDSFMRVEVTSAQAI